MVERLTRAQDRESNGQVGSRENAICQAHADFQVRDAIAVSCMSAKKRPCVWVQHLVSIRQSCIDGCDAELQTPKDRSVKRPSYDLDLGAPDSIVVLFRVVLEGCALLGCHVAIGKAIEIGADEVCCGHFGSEEELSDKNPSLVSVSSRARGKCVG